MHSRGGLGGGVQSGSAKLIGCPRLLVRSLISYAAHSLWPRSSHVAQRVFVFLNRAAIRHRRAASALQRLKGSVRLLRQPVAGVAPELFPHHWIA